MDKEEIELDEVLTIQQREKRRQIIRRYETKIERARELARKKMAPEKNIKKRAYAQARQIVRKRVAGQRGAEYEKLGPSEKMAIDRAVETKTKLIKKLAARLIPRVKQAEQQRLAAFMKGQALTNNGQPEGNSKVNEQFNEIFNEAFPPYDTAGVMGRSVDSPVVGNRMASKVGNKASKDDKDPKGKNTPIIQYGKFGENLEVDSPEFRAIAKKADKSDIDLEILGEVYNRGLDAWTENLNVSQQQYAFARVNSYINQGRTYFNEDADLHENYLDGKGPGKPGDAERHGLTGKSAAELRKIRSSKTASPRTKQLAHWMLNMHHNEDVNEATYQGREVPLNKPMPGDVKKSKVYVDPDGDGKAQKVNFGSKELSIKKHIPARKKSYCARSGGQGNLTDKTSANYWSRKAWNCEETEIEEVKAQPYVKPLHNESGKQVGWKSSNGHHVKYWQMFAKKSALKHAKLEESADVDDFLELNDGEINFFIESGVEFDLTEATTRNTKKLIQRLHDKEQGQTYAGRPYSSHPKSVMRLGIKVFGGKRFDQNARKAALLHDTIEDTPTTPETLLKRKFHPDVVKAVQLLSKDKTKSYEGNIDNIANGDTPAHRIAQHVKYVDNMSNYLQEPKPEWDQDRVQKQKGKYMASMEKLGRVLGVDAHTKLNPKWKLKTESIVDKSKSSNREYGTKKLTKIYKSDTPGESILPPSPSASSKKRMSVQSVERDSTPMTPSNNADLPTSPKSSYNKETQIKKKILEAGNKQNDPKKRLQGTDSLVKAYVKDTPCMSVNESFNIAFASGIGVTLTSKDHGMQIQGGFALHPSVIDQMDEMERLRLEQEFEEEVEPADRKPVVVRAHKDAYGNTIPAKTYFRKRTTPIVNADDNPNDGQ